MTPAYVQSKVLHALMLRYGNTYIGPPVGDPHFPLETIRGNLPAGWAAAGRRGTEPPPLGGVLVGAVQGAEPGECDTNLYIYPVTPEAMVLRETARPNLIHRVEPDVTPAP